MLLLGIAMFLTSKAEKETEAGAGIAIFSISIVFIGGIFIYFGHKNGKCPYNGSRKEKWK